MHFAHKQDAKMNIKYKLTYDKQSIASHNDLVLMLGNTINGHFEISSIALVGNDHPYVTEIVQNASSSIQWVYLQSDEIL